jgi:hypothetical protein
MTIATNQPISALTIAELESLITQIVRRVLREEIRRTSAVPGNGDAVPSPLLATFGAWEDERSADEIIAEIYKSRTVSAKEVAW